MNKTILIAGGAAVASLAVGAAGGYLVAKKRFDKQLPEIVEREIAGVKKYYSVMLMEAKSGKPASPADIVKNAESLDDESEDWDAETQPDEPEGLSEKDKEAIAKGREHLSKAKRAMEAKTDYNAISTEKVKASSKGLIERNIFDNDEKNVFDNIGSKKKELPPRDPQSGRFQSTHTDQTVPAQREPEQDPYIISQEEFLQNEFEYEQESLHWYIRNKTLVLSADIQEAVDIKLVGEGNLTLFPEDVPRDQPNILCVRNEVKQIEYEILLTHGDLTADIGLGLGDEDAEDLERAKYL